MTLTVNQYRILNCCWNAVYRKIFEFNKWEPVRTSIHGLGQLDLRHIIWLMRAQFYKHLMASSNAILQLLFSIYCNSEFKTDFSLTLAQLPINLTRKCVYTDFKAQIIF